MRLIKTILVLTGAGFLMPSPPENLAAQSEPAPQVSTIQMLSSATSAFSDVASFCIRQPGVCETATYVAGRLEAKAKYSAKLIYEWASDATSDPGVPQGSQEAIAVDPLETGSVKLAAADETPAEGQSTLQIEDLIPEWRGPVPAKVPPVKKEG